MAAAQAAVEVVVDYDETRWIGCPPPGLWDPQEWSTRVAGQWAAETDRATDQAWADLLARMLVVADSRPWLPVAVARLVHVLAPAGEAPSLMPVDLSMFGPDDAPQGIAQALVRATDPELIEPPIVEQIAIDDHRPATRIVRVLNDGGAGALRVELFLVWRGHEQAELVFNTSSYEMGRVLVMQDDLTALAAATTLVPTAAPA